MIARTHKQALNNSLQEIRKLILRYFQGFELVSWLPLSEQKIINKLEKIEFWLLRLKRVRGGKDP